MNFLRMTMIVITLNLLTVFQVFSQDQTFKQARYDAAVKAGHLANKSIKESSGLAASRLNRNILWTVNDGNNPAVVYAMGTDGADLGGVRILKTRNRDWEDLASFRYNRTSFLLVADTGDNFKNRDKYYLYIIKEPGLKRRGNRAIKGIRRHNMIRFSYEDGSHDCESVAVDVGRKKILLLTKEEPPVLYELRLILGKKKSDQVARRLTEVNHLPKLSISEMLNNPGYGPYRLLTTAMDISPDSRRAVILTYNSAFIFFREKKESWAKAFQQVPEIIPIPDLPQAEAICFGYDGKTIFLTSEKRPTPLLRLDVKK